MTSADIEASIAAVLREHGIRYTDGRRALVRVLLRSGGPLSAQELASETEPPVPLPTVYRTLAVLGDCDVVTPHFSTRGVTRYELSEHLQGHHHHLVCITCGAVDDIDVPTDLEVEVGAIVSRIGDGGSFVALRHVLEIEGICRRCA